VVTEDSSTASSISSLSSGLTAPEGNLSKVTPKPAPQPPPKLPSVSEDPHVDPDPDGLEFVGAFMADAAVDDAVWMAQTSDLDDIALSVGVTLSALDDDK